jgi:hypothetical protein
MWGGGLAVCMRKGNIRVNNTVSVKADAKFLRRIFAALVAATLISGGMVAVTTVQAMTAQGHSACMIYCQ